MQITVNVLLGKDQTFGKTADEAAAAVLAALGTDPDLDYCTVYVQASLDPGVAGTPPPGELPPP
jgi:hypothetical protein